MSEISAIAAEFGLLIVTATILSIVTRKTGQPKLIGYIVTGILLGPIVLDWAAGTELTMLLSELGLAFLLFFIGIELRFEEVKDFIGPVMRISIPQMGATALLGFVVAWWFGFGTGPSVIVGLLTMYGSTAVIVKLLTDKGEHTTVPGKLNIGVLLVQDIVAVVLLAVLATGAANVQGLAANLVKVSLLIGGIAVLTVASSRYVLPAVSDVVFRDIQTFLIHGLAWFFLFVTAAEYLGLSVEIGAFLAGLGLAQIPYSSEIRERVRPLTNLFVALFFINFGLGMTPGAFTVYWREAVIASVILMAGKFLVMFLLTDWQQFTPNTSFKAAINMTQTSEFSLVLGGVALASGYITQEILGFLSIVGLLTMAASSYLINYNEEIYGKCRRFIEWMESEEKSDAEVMRLDDHAIIVGYNDIARDIVPVLREYVDEVVLVDRNPHNTREADTLETEYIFGDFKHRGIRESAGIGRARLLISFSEEIEANTKILDERRPEALVFVRATTRSEAEELYDFGADYIIRKNAIAADQFTEYLELYFRDRDAFLRKAEETAGKLKGDDDG